MALAPTLFELKLKISSAKDLKNVNWRHGSLKPSVSAWVEPNAKSSTKVDHDGDTSPSWNETFHIPVSSSIDDSALYLEIVHHKPDGEDDTKPIVGSARLSLHDVGFDVEAFCTLELRRPSERPQGKIDVEISVKDLLHRPLDQYYAYAIAAPYSATPPANSTHSSARYLPSVYAYQEPTIGQQASYVQIMAAVDEVGVGTETVLDVGSVAGAFDGLAIPVSLGPCPLEVNILKNIGKED